jgi:hypothetical protein
MNSIPALFEAYAAVRILLDLVLGEGSVGLNVFFVGLLAVMATYTGWRIRFLRQRLREIE